MMKCHFENKQQVSGESKLLFNIFLSSIKKKETFFNFFFLLLYLGYVQTEDGQSILNLHFSCLQQIDCLCVCKRAVDCSIWTGVIYSVSSSMVFSTWARKKLRKKGKGDEDEAAGIPSADSLSHRQWRLLMNDMSLVLRNPFQIQKKIKIINGMICERERESCVPNSTTSQQQMNNAFLKRIQ